MLGKFDIEVYDPDKDDWAQAVYLVHGLDDVLWTDNIDVAIDYIKTDCKRLQRSIK